MARSDSAAAMLANIIEQTLDAAAVTGGSPTASNVGNVTSDAPPTIPDSEPPIRPAPNSMRWFGGT